MKGRISKSESVPLLGENPDHFSTVINIQPPERLAPYESAISRLWKSKNHNSAKLVLVCALPYSPMHYPSPRQKSHTLAALIIGTQYRY